MCARANIVPNTIGMSPFSFFILGQSFCNSLRIKLSTALPKLTVAATVCGPTDRKPALPKAPFVGTCSVFAIAPLVPIAVFRKSRNEHAEAWTSRTVDQAGTLFFSCGQ